MNEENMKVQLGDIFVSAEAFQNMNAIVFGSKGNSKLEFNAYLLQSYLKFLELIVVNERILLTHLDNESHFDNLDGIYLDAPIIRSMPRLVGDLELSEDVNSKLRS